MAEQERRNSLSDGLEIYREQRHFKKGGGVEEGGRVS